MDYVHHSYLCNTSKISFLCSLHLILHSLWLNFLLHLDHHHIREKVIEHWEASPCLCVILTESGKFFCINMSILNFFMTFSSWCPQGLHFQRSIEDMEKWLDDVENELKAPYSDNDLVVLNSHLKKQEELEEDISSHRDRLQELVVTAQQFQKGKHFLADELEEKVDQLVQRYANACPVSCHYFPPFVSLSLPCTLFSFLLCITLNRIFCFYSLLICDSHWVPFKTCRYKRLRDPLQERHGNLEASRLQYQFFKDVDEELAWVREKLPMASSRDYGQSLATVQSLQEKHQVMSCKNNSQSLESERTGNLVCLWQMSSAVLWLTGIMMPRITFIPVW